MNWQSDAENQDYSEKPYSTLSGGRLSRLFSRSEFPFILLGGGLLVLLLLFFIFFSGGETPSKENGRTVSQRLTRLESRVDSMAGFRQQLKSMEAQMKGIEETVEANKNRIVPDTRVVDQMQANTKAIENTGQRLTVLEDRLNKLNHQIQEIKEGLSRKPDVKTSKASDAKPGFHVVQEGDTLYSIAKDNHVDLERFLKVNDLNENSVIYPGQKLRIPKN